jgi:flagellin
MIINHNLSAMFAHRQQGLNTRSAQGSIEKLSSGMRINRAGDDASGLAVSEKMRSQIRGLHRAVQNTMDGISLIQTSEGFLQETQDVLHRLRELAVQSANGIYTSEDRMQIQVEVSQLVDEIDRIASHAQFNGLHLLTGRFSRDMGTNFVTASMYIHFGANVDQRERVYIGTMTAEALGMVQEQSVLSISTIENANRALGYIDEALRKVNSQRADLGAYQNRLTLTAEGNRIAAENLQAAESQIRDSDMAKEIVDFTRNQILIQASTAMLAQANVQTQSVLQLLG